MCVSVVAYKRDSMTSHIPSVRLSSAMEFLIRPHISQMLVQRCRGKLAKGRHGDQKHL